jgi:hypothetical protein
VYSRIISYYFVDLALQLMIAAGRCSEQFFGGGIAIGAQLLARSL